MSEQVPSVVVFVALGGAIAGLLGLLRAGSAGSPAVALGDHVIAVQTDGRRPAPGLIESTPGIAAAAYGVAVSSQQAAKPKHGSTPTNMPDRNSVPVEPVTW